MYSICISVAGRFGLWRGFPEASCNSLGIAAAIQNSDHINHWVRNAIIDRERKSFREFPMQPRHNFVNPSLRFQRAQIGKEGFDEIIPQSVPLAMIKCCGIGQVVTSLNPEFDGAYESFLDLGLGIVQRQGLA